MVKSTKRIKKDVIDQLQRSARVDEEKVEVQVQGYGEVTLTGSVNSLLERRAAGSLAWRVLGVYKVNNKIQVVSGEEENISRDEEIKSRISKILLWNSNLDSSNIQMSVDDGLVTIEGEVDSFWKLSLVETLISQLSGVREIKNNLEVIPSEDRSDDSIKEDIFLALGSNISVDISLIDLEVDDGKVKVKGTISSSIARDAIIETIQSTAGVKALIDELEIRY